MEQINSANNREMVKLLVAQFLTALADNAILFTAVAMVMQGALQGDWYVSAMQGCFLIAFVVLAPWVGPLADSHSKPWVLYVANLIKAGGAAMMLLGAYPLLAYAVIGIGAAAYSPAKYGLLPELVNNEDALVRANGWIESSTIMAILGGTVLGAVVADYSIQWALILVLGLYLLSALVAKLMHALPAANAQENHGGKTALKDFKSSMKTLLSIPRVRFSTLGVSVFWSVAVVLRLVIIAWAPVVLLLSTSTDISLLTLFIALGIGVGALLAPKFFPLKHLRRTRFAAYGMGACVLLLTVVDSLWLARTLLFMAGLCGGLFVVPINAVLQDIGQKTVGSGRAVAVQHFFENLAMLIATGAYTLAVSFDVTAVLTLAVLGAFTLFVTILIARNLPREEKILKKQRDD